MRVLHKSIYTLAMVLGLMLSVSGQKNDQKKLPPKPPPPVITPKEDKRPPKNDDKKKPSYANLVIVLREIQTA